MNARAAREPADTDAVAHVFVDALEERVGIDGPDGHHLQRVRRLSPGEAMTAADGSGAWRSYEVVEVATGRLTLEARGEIEVSAEPRVRVALAVALTKGGLDDVVAAVTELGVTRVIPVQTVRTVVRWDRSRAERAVTRLRAVAREAAMQSRRPRVPTVDDLVELPQLVAHSGLVVADRDGLVPADLAEPAGEWPEWTVLVGPEGGIAPEELEILSAAPRVGLGAYVLRAATAPIAAVAVLTAEAKRRTRA